MTDYSCIIIWNDFRINDQYYEILPKCKSGSEIFIEAPMRANICIIIIYTIKCALSTVKPELTVTSIKQPTCRSQSDMFLNFNYVLKFTSSKQPPALIKQPHFVLPLGGLTQV